jgi:hypothetical protein
MLIEELDNDCPVIVGAGGHAMVLTALQYLMTPYGPNVTAAGVFDPWPGMGARALSLAEFHTPNLGGTLQFVATTKIVDL